MRTLSFFLTIYFLLASDNQRDALGYVNKVLEEKDHLLVYCMDIKKNKINEP